MIEKMTHAKVMVVVQKRGKSMYIADVTLKTKLWIYEISFRVGDEELLKCKRDITLSIIEVGKRLHLIDTVDVEYTITFQKRWCEEYIEHEEYRILYKSDYSDIGVVDF